MNTQQLAQLVPALNYNSASPWNTARTIRGLGSNTLSVSAANDGIEPVEILRGAARRFAGRSAALPSHGFPVYAPPSTNVFDRLTDIDAPLHVDTQDGGVSLDADWRLGAKTLASITAWRWWDWDVANDRDRRPPAIE